MEDDSKATVSLFDIEFMILWLLIDDSLMKDENLARGYDIFIGDVDHDHPNNHNYGEIYTCDAQEGARSRFCGSNGQHIPLALIVFGIRHILIYTERYPSLPLYSLPHLLIVWPETSLVFGDHLNIFPIYLIERVRPIPLNL